MGDFYLYRLVVQGGAGLRRGSRLTDNGQTRGDV